MVAIDRVGLGPPAGAAAVATAPARVDEVTGPAPAISVVIPCLDEAATIGRCVEKALAGIARAGVPGEVIVADNGSADRSAEIAAAAGARVVREPRRGYGNAYLAGFAAARGQYLVMGDADDTYDFTELDRFIAPLRADDCDYVLGSRFRGRILPGAMSPLSRLGNPLLTGLLNLLFGLRVSDAHSGMRAFTRAAYDRMRLGAPGMEFASEIVINAAKAGLRVTEVPITLYPRAGGPSKLHPFRDGWRHLRFMLLYSPNWLFLAPGLALFALGLLALAALAPGPLPLGGHAWDVHAMVLASLCAILGGQVLTLGLSAKAYSYRHRFDPHDRLIRRFYRVFSLERGLVCGLVLFGAGFAINAGILKTWLDADMGPLDAVRPALAAATLMILGTQIVFASFLLSILDIGPEGEDDR